MQIVAIVCAALLGIGLLLTIVPSNRVRETWSVIVTLLAVCILCGATYALFDVLMKARSTGLVEVAPRYRGAVREKVPLPQAWGYVLGLVLFAVGGALAVMNRFRIRGAGGGALEALALGALFFTMSGGLVSSFSAVVVTGVFVGAPVALYFAVQNGRTPLVFFWLLVLFSVSALAWLR